MWSSSTIKHQQHHRQTLSLHVHDVVRKCNCYYCFFGWKWCELFSEWNRKCWNWLWQWFSVWVWVSHSLSIYSLLFFYTHICIQLIFKLFVCAFFSTLVSFLVHHIQHLTALCIVLSRLSIIIIIRLYLKFVAHFALTLCVIFCRLLTTHDFSPSAHCSVFKMWFCMYHVFIVHSG